MPDPVPSVRLTGPVRRILLVLLSGASNLTCPRVCNIARVGTGTFYPLIGRLKDAGWAEGAPGDGRYSVYRLTPAGRAGVLELLGLEEADA